jgi:hypothetical protein
LPRFALLRDRSEIGSIGEARARRTGALRHPLSVEAAMRMNPILPIRRKIPGESSRRRSAPAAGTARFAGATVQASVFAFNVDTAPVAESLGSGRIPRTKHHEIRR